MSDQNPRFGFTPEDPPSSTGGVEERFPFFLQALCLCALCLVVLMWPAWHKPSRRNLSSARDIQNLPAVQEAVSLEPFLALLKSKSGPGRLTKIEVDLQAEDPLVLQEVQRSRHKVRDHLIFILSEENVSVFNDPEKRLALEQEIISQLNLFLTAGKISGLRLTPVFLN